MSNRLREVESNHVQLKDALRRYRNETSRRISSIKKGYEDKILFLLSQLRDAEKKAEELTGTISLLESQRNLPNINNDNNDNMRLVYPEIIQNDIKINNTNTTTDNNRIQRPHTVNAISYHNNKDSHERKNTNNLHTGNSAWDNNNDQGHSQGEYSPHRRKNENTVKKEGCESKDDNRLSADIEELRRKWLAEKRRREVLEGRNGQLLREVRTLRMDSR